MTLNKSPPLYKSHSWLRTAWFWGIREKVWKLSSGRREKDPTVWKGLDWNQWGKLREESDNIHRKVCEEFQTSQCSYLQTYTLDARVQSCFAATIVISRFSKFSAPSFMIYNLIDYYKVGCYGIPTWLSGKESTCQGDMWVKSLGWEDLLEKEMATPQCSCLGNPLDRGVWEATVHGITKSRMLLSE